jgi:hypothetical protein
MDAATPKGGMARWQFDITPFQGYKKLLSLSQSQGFALCGHIAPFQGL